MKKLFARVVKAVKKVKFAVGMAISTLAVAASVAVSADATTPASLLPAGAEQIIEDFAADLPPTVLGLYVIIVPAILGVWAIGFAINKGLAKLRQGARKA